MTLRDYFAVQVMPTVIQETEVKDVGDSTMLIFKSFVAKTAYEFADAMMEARK